MFFIILLLIVCISNGTRDSDATSIILPAIIQFNASDTILAARRQTCDVTPRSQQHSNAMCRFVGTDPFQTLPAPFRTCLPLAACYIQQQPIIVAICAKIQHFKISIRETHDRPGAEMDPSIRRAVAGHCWGTYQSPLPAPTARMPNCQLATYHVPTACMLAHETYIYLWWQTLQPWMSAASRLGDLSNDANGEILNNYCAASHDSVVPGKCGMLYNIYIYIYIYAHYKDTHYTVTHIYTLHIHTTYILHITYYIYHIYIYIYIYITYIHIVHYTFSLSLSIYIYIYICIYHI